MTRHPQFKWHEIIIYYYMKESSTQPPPLMKFKKLDRRKERKANFLKYFTIIYFNLFCSTCIHQVLKENVKSSTKFKLK